jgi:hypothetical protein
MPYLIKWQQQQLGSNKDWMIVELDVWGTILDDDDDAGRCSRLVTEEAEVFVYAMICKSGKSNDINGGDLALPPWLSSMANPPRLDVNPD